MNFDFLPTRNDSTFTNGIDTFKIRNYTDTIDILDVFEDFKTSDLFLYSVQNDERIEVISYNIYRSANYWDFIMITNGIKNQTDLPVNEDILQKRVEKDLADWDSHFKKFKTEKQREMFKEKLNQFHFLKNERYRTIRYLNPDLINTFKSKMSDFVTKEKLK